MANGNNAAPAGNAPAAASAAPAGGGNAGGGQPPAPPVNNPLTRRIRDTELSLQHLVGRVDTIDQAMPALADVVRASNDSLQAVDELVTMVTDGCAELDAQKARLDAVNLRVDDIVTRLGALPIQATIARAQPVMGRYRQLRQNP